VLLHCLQNGETQKSHFFTQMLYQYIEEIKSDYLNSGSLFDSQLILTLLYDSLNLVINAFSSALLGCMVQDKGS